MEREHIEQHIRENQLHTWEKLMCVALGSAVTILFHLVDPLRDAIIILTLVYTTLAGFYLLWGSPWHNLPLTEARSRAIFGHLFGSWLVYLGIFSYSRLPILGLGLLAYTVFLLVMYWRTRKRLSASGEIFP